MLSIKKKELLIALIASEVFLCLGLLTCLILLSQYYAAAQAERRATLASLAMWENRIKKFPNQPQTYIAASLYALKLNDTQKATEYAQKAVFLDPSLSQVTQLQDLLEK